jgi:hypothetical protein
MLHVTPSMVGTLEEGATCSPQKCREKFHVQLRHAMLCVPGWGRWWRLHAIPLPLSSSTQCLPAVLEMMSHAEAWQKVVPGYNQPPYQYGESNSRCPIVVMLLQLTDRCRARREE